MDNFSKTVKETLEQVAKKFLFIDNIDDVDFKEVEGYVESGLLKSLGSKPKVRWIEHSQKLARRTFVSTFMIQNPEDKDDIRKFTISPEIVQSKFDDAISEEKTEDGKQILID